ncbi:hypothetical protein HK099_004696 [Clydaea vesicula]|uniref:SAC3/GANP/THP3 conserved domain-containing protein n=1 Tax=Clydaea vesicula TaxID=447962 RepID=A0AAD5U6U3_9FUNG|nr:hypothetical protein HK099_004696 [Clydaea vesicula]
MVPVNPAEAEEEEEGEGNLRTNVSAFKFNPSATPFQPADDTAAIKSVDLNIGANQEESNYAASINSKPITTLKTFGTSKVTNEDRAERFTKETDIARRWEQMKKERTKLHAKYVKEGKMASVEHQGSLEEAIEIKGECETMCPEFEILDREVTNGLDFFEKKTFDYLMGVLNEHGLAATYSFIRDRTRCIRNEFTMQRWTGKEAIECHERCARYSIMCCHDLCESVKDIHMEHEQLRKTLQTLKQYYDDSSIVYPNEAEFRAYYILSHLFQGDIAKLAENNWRKEIYFDPRVQLALEIQSLAQRNNDKIKPVTAGARQNFVKFFKLLAKVETSYLQSCLVHIEIKGIRKHALKLMQNAYYFLNSNGLPMKDLVSMLCLNNFEEAKALLDYHAIPYFYKVNESDPGQIFDNSMNENFVVKIGKVFEKVSSAFGEKKSITVNFEEEQNKLVYDYKRENFILKKRESLNDVDIVLGKSNVLNPTPMQSAFSSSPQLNNKSNFNFSNSKHLFVKNENIVKPNNPLTPLSHNSSVQQQSQPSTQVSTVSPKLNIQKFTDTPFQASNGKPYFFAQLNTAANTAPTNNFNFIPHMNNNIFALPPQSQNATPTFNNQNHHSFSITTENRLATATAPHFHTATYSSHKSPTYIPSSPSIINSIPMQDLSAQVTPANVKVNKSSECKQQKSFIISTSSTSNVTKNFQAVPVVAATYDFASEFLKGNPEDHVMGNLKNLAILQKGQNEIILEKVLDEIAYEIVSEVTLAVSHKIFQEVMDNERVNLVIDELANDILREYVSDEISINVPCIPSVNNESLNQYRTRTKPSIFKQVFNVQKLDLVKQRVNSRIKLKYISFWRNRIIKINEVKNAEKQKLTKKAVDFYKSAIEAGPSIFGKVVLDDTSNEYNGNGIEQQEMFNLLELNDVAKISLRDSSLFQSKIAKIKVEISNGLLNSVPFNTLYQKYNFNFKCILGTTNDIFEIGNGLDADIKILQRFSVNWLLGKFIGKEVVELSVDKENLLELNKEIFKMEAKDSCYNEGSYFCRFLVQHFKTVFEEPCYPLKENAKSAFSGITVAMYQFSVFNYSLDSNLKSQFWNFERKKFYFFLSKFPLNSNIPLVLIFWDVANFFFDDLDKFNEECEINLNLQSTIKEGPVLDVTCLLIPVYNIPAFGMGFNKIEAEKNFLNRMHWLGQRSCQIPILRKTIFEDFVENSAYVYLINLYKRVTMLSSARLICVNVELNLEVFKKLIELLNILIETIIEILTDNRLKNVCYPPIEWTKSRYENENTADYTEFDDMPQNISWNSDEKFTEIKKKLECFKINLQHHSSHVEIINNVQKSINLRQVFKLVFLLIIIRLLQDIYKKFVFDCLLSIPHFDRLTIQHLITVIKQEISNFERKIYDDLVQFPFDEILIHITQALFCSLKKENINYFYLQGRICYFEAQFKKVLNLKVNEIENYLKIFFEESNSYLEDLTSRKRSRQLLDPKKIQEIYKLDEEKAKKVKVSLEAARLKTVVENANKIAEITKKKIFGTDIC